MRRASIDAPSFAQWGNGVVPAGTTHAAVRTWMRLDSRGVDQSVDLLLLTVANSQGRRNFDFFVTGDTQRFKWDLFSADADESNFTVVPGRWYLIEVLVAYAGTRHSATVRIDGVDQGTIVSTGNVVTLALVTIGTHSAKTHAQAYDDLFMRFGAGPVDWIDPSPLDGASYRVRAFDRALNRSGWSPAVWVSFGGSDTTAPPVPRSLRAAATAGGTVTLSWEGVVDSGGSGLREYAIQRDGRWYGWVPAGTTTFVDHAPLVGAVYRVRAIDRALNLSAWSASAVRRTGSASTAKPDEGFRRRGG